MLEGVGDQVRDGAAQVAARAEHGQPGPGLEPQRDAAPVGHGVQLRDDLAGQPAEVDRLALGAVLARFETRDQQQRLGQPLQVVDRDQAVAQHRLVALGQRAVGSVGGLAQGHRERRQRRAQVVREHVHQVADDRLAIAQRLVALGQLDEQPRLPQRVDGDRGEAGGGRGGHVVGCLRAGRDDQHAEGGAAVGQRDRQRAARAQPVEHEAADRIDRAHHRHQPVFRDAVRQRGDLRRRALVDDLDRLVTRARGEDLAVTRGVPEGALRRQRARRLAHDRAHHQARRERGPDALGHAGQRRLAARPRLLRGQPADPLGALLHHRAQIADQRDREHREQPVADADGLPAIPVVPGVDDRRGGVGEQRAGHQRGRQAAAAGQHGQHDRHVEEDRDHQRLRREADRPRTPPPAARTR